MAFPSAPRGPAKRWVVTPPAPKEFLDTFPELPSIVAHLLYHRGIRTQADIDAFFNPDYGQDLCDPFLFRDMERAVARILRARDASEHILVHGDYDADGVSGAVILADTLEAIGCTVDVFLPHRDREGYGFSDFGLAYAREHGSRLIITCDCGISDAPRVRAAQDGGIDVIITDHHMIPTDPATGAPVVPPAHAILHPKVAGEPYPYKERTGGGVAFALAHAIVRRDAESTNRRLPDGFEKWLLDCVAISTVADYGPLIGENRVLVTYGLVVLQKTRRLGLRALYEVAGITPEKITPATIGFQIAPRINAAGRIDHANEALKLLRTTDPVEARALAERLNATNVERQRLVEIATAEAIEQVGELGDRRFLIVIGDTWAPGILGLIATKVRDTFHRPTIACTRADGKIVGSGRSTPALNLVEALRTATDLLGAFGGHPAAAGLTVKGEVELAELRERMESFARERLTSEDLVPKLAIDWEFALEEITWDIVELLLKLGPFGVGNPVPRYIARGVTIDGIMEMGATGKHLRLIVHHRTSAQKKMIVFGYQGICPDIRIGDVVDIVFEVDQNEWNGNREIQLKAVDIRPAMSA